MEILLMGLLGIGTIIVILLAATVQTLKEIKVILEDKNEK